MRIELRGIAARLALAALAVLPAVPARAQGNHALLVRGAEVWAVGDSGRSYRSFDFGGSFNVTQVGDEPLRAIAAHGLNVLTAGDSGLVWRSADWGGSWGITVLPGAPVLTALDWPADTAAFVVGGGGGVWRSSNHGATWTPQSSGTGARLTAVRFSDAQHGWITGAGGFAARTSDGGATWVPVATGTTRDLLGVDVRDNRVWLVGAYGTALRSTDGGAQFTPLDLKLDAHASVQAVNLAPSDTVWIAGGGGFLWRSTDDGASWSFPVHPMHGAISDIAFVPGAAYASSSRHRALIRSANNGATWSVAGNTTSLARTWTVRYGPFLGTVRGASLNFNPQNPRTLYAMLGIQLLVSRDEGETWTPQGIPVPGATTVKTNALVISPKDSNLVVAAIGTPDRIVRSTDGGASWTDIITKDFGEYGIPLEIDPNHPDTLFFGVDSDVIWRSINFGLTWLPWSSTAFRSPCDLIVVPESDSAVVEVGDGVTGTGTGVLWRAASSTTFMVADSTGGSEIPGMACSRLRPHTSFATNWATNGVRRSQDDGRTWKRVATTTATWGVDVCREDPNVVIYGLYSGGSSHLSLSGGDSASFVPIGLSSSNYTFLLRDRGLFLAEQGNGIYKMNFAYGFPLAGAKAVAVSAPNGGESWPAGASRTITWNSAQIGLARLEWRSAPGATWQWIADVEGAAGRYDWQVPAQATALAKVRVSEAWTASPSDTSNAAFTIVAAALTTNPKPLDAGGVHAGGARRVELTLANPGTATLTIGAITTGTTNFHPGRASLSLAPGASDTIGVWFTPGQVAGFIDTLWIASNAAGAPLSSVALAGTGTGGPSGAWSASPDPLDFGPALIGVPTRFALHVHNIGQAAMSLSWVSSTSPSFWTGRVALTLPQFGQDTLGVFYQPQSTAPDTAWLILTTDVPGQPQLLRVTGYGSNIVDVGPGPAAEFALWPNEPNPFTATTLLRFSLPAAAHVRLEVYDVRGMRVSTLLDAERGAGSHAVLFRPLEARLAAGVYFVRLSAGARVATRKMLLLR